MNSSIKTPISCLLVVPILWLFLSGCKKDDHEVVSKTALLTSKGWIVTAHTFSPAFDFDGDGVDDSNLYQFYDDCIKDDITKFYTNGKGDYDEGATKCDPGDPQTTHFSWSFTTNESKLVIDTDVADVVELTSTVLKLKNECTFYGTTYTEIISFSH